MPDSSAQLAVILGAAAVAVVASALVAALVVANKDTGGGGGGGGGGDGGGGKQEVRNGDGGGAYQKAYSTFYNSYPPCCPGSAAYNPQASKSECTNYSGCKYMGAFAALSDKKSLEWVKSNNIAAMFQVGQTADSWRAKWANKKLRLKNPKNGTTMDVTVVDTCGDADCDNCCTKNAKRAGNTLIDLEAHTARKFWGGKLEGAAELEWKCLNC